KLRGNYLVESGMTVTVQIVHASLQVHREDQAHQAQVMIAVQVTDKNMIDAVEVYLKAHQLQLSSFAAIDHKEFVLDLNELSRGMPSVGGECSAGTQDCYLEIHQTGKKQKTKTCISLGLCVIRYSILVGVVTFEIFFDLVHKDRINRLFNCRKYIEHAVELG